ncbi:globin [Pseudothauera nasutitermitis]|uniref:Globin n=1 Tax=Pseudothauera nasutitermitis TaxID=2565930 RepID=A0A4S4B1S1_9RHOO|nr:group II truncated hemoglobin [Pseudothauera nasutitermitis]THF66105.1 globin [Pseudothauera nasutitermitis]
MPLEPQPLPVLTPYQMIGGEPAVRALVDRFYQLMDELPEAWGVRRMHAEDLSGSAEKLFLFLSGWLGGPNLYVERFGPPFLRARHLPFSIGAAERDQWMLCMRQALEEIVSDAEARDHLLRAFTGLADHMRNRVEAPVPTRADQPL